MASNNDMFPDANRPLPQPMSIYHQQGPQQMHLPTF